MHISVASASQVLALNTAAYPNYNVYVLNSTQTAWQSIPGWLSLGEIGPDGSIWGISGSTIYTWTGSGWNVVQGSLNSITVGSTVTVWGMNSSHQLFNYVGGSAVWKGYAPPFTPSSAENGIAAGGDMALAVHDTSGGQRRQPRSSSTLQCLRSASARQTLRDRRYRINNPLRPIRAGRLPA
jgi:hypothetical protein